MVKEEIKKIIGKAAEKSLNIKLEEINIEVPAQEKFGDYTANIALILAKKLNEKPLAVAGRIAEEARSLNSGLFEKIEVVSPGFINFFLSRQYLQNQVRKILRQKDRFGFLKAAKKQKVNVEFVSANPTGPLTAGNGRGGFCGDVLANVLQRAGHSVKREYLINDVGRQIKQLGDSITGHGNTYRGAYIEELKKRVKTKNPYKAGQEAAAIILQEMIKPSLKKAGIKFDIWFLESWLYRKKQVEKTLKWLEKKGYAYRKEGALWFKSTAFGDDKDRVLIKSNGEKTYFASDIAYLKNKFKRGFNKLIFLWGADHYGYVKRMQAAVAVLGHGKEQAEFILMQLVKLFRGGKEVRMSKRKGTYITLDEIINEIGLDAARFFFLMRSPGNHLNFDLDLAKERSEKNPVYYVQYAYARISSILRRAPAKMRNSAFDSSFLNSPAELKLIRQLLRFPEIIEDTAKDYQVQRLPRYALETASFFHQFYDKCRILGEKSEISRARLALIKATKIVLENALDLMGISAPEKM